MKCLVAVKRVVDPYVNIRVKSDNTAVETANVKMAMNPFDEIAVEEAIKLKEAGIVSEVIAVSVGNTQTQETLRQALARGCEQAILVETDKELQPIDIAQVLQKIVQLQNPDLILMGKQAIDNDCNQTGQMLAALLDYPQATFASKIELDASAKTAKVTREVDGGLEVLDINLPAVITTDLRLNEPRYISLPNVMKAKKKPLNITKLEDLDLEIKDRVKVVSVTPPKVKEPGIIVETVTELVDKLKNEKKVLG